MQEPEQDQEAAPPAEPPRPSRLATLARHGRNAASAVFGFLPELGLLLFMLTVPAIIVAYPAWRITDRLIDYTAAQTVEAKLAAIDIRTVEANQDQATPFEARKHYEIVFFFKSVKDQAYESRIELSWPAPGLKGRLESQYQIGDSYNIYLLPDHSVLMEETIAKDSFYRLTGLMGLVFVASALMYMMWKRLKHRMPANMPRFPVATEHSIMLAQLITLIVTVLWAVMMTVSPLVIQSWLFLAVYWGVVALLSLSLRLLLFADPEPEPAPPPVDDGKRRHA